MRPAYCIMKEPKAVMEGNTMEKQGMFVFGDRFNMYDITPVENLFIAEYMLKAPGDYVKVYLYGLHRCYHAQSNCDYATMARDLEMSQEDIRAAFQYWERQGIVYRMGDNPPVYAFYNLKALLLEKGNPMDREPYAHRAFHAELQKLFGARVLQSQEYRTVGDWMEVLNLSEESVLLLVRTAIAERGTNVSFKVLNQKATMWANAGIDSVEAAREFANRQNGIYEGVKRVLKQMGLRRMPMIDEEQMYGKWINDWGMTPDAVLFACGELTKISNPNFAYLDRVLEGKRKEGLLTAQAMEQAKVQQSESVRPIQQVLEALGEKQTVTKDLLDIYETWRGHGFTEDAILLCAKQCKRQGWHTLQKVDETLQSWAKQGAYTVQQMQQVMEQVKKTNVLLREVFEHAGIERSPNVEDRKRYAVWQQTGADQAMICLAAEYALSAKNKESYITRVLHDWQNKGISTVEAARNEHDVRAAARPGDKKPLSKPVSAQNYEQRKYDPNELDKVLGSFEDLEG